jgi:hypothetical protein
VQRPRFFTVLALTFWLFTAIVAILIGLACLAAVVFSGERGGWFVWIALMAALAAYTLPRGVRAVKRDRALKRAPLAELARVQLAKTRGELVEPDGTVVPLAQVTAKIVVDTSGEHDTHAVWLHYGDKRFHAMEFTRDDRLDSTRDLLRELGIRIER